MANVRFGSNGDIRLTEFSALGAAQKGVRVARLVSLSIGLSVLVCPSLEAFQKCCHRSVLPHHSAISPAAGGIDAKQFLDMAKSVNSGAAVAGWERFFTIEDGQPVQHPEPDDILLSKDVQHAAELAKSLGLELPLTQGAAETARRWIESRGTDPR